MSSRGTLASEFGKSVIQLQLPESPPQLRCGWAPSEGNTVFRLEHTALRFCDFVVGLGSSSLQLGTFLLIDLPIKIPEEEFIRLAFFPEVPLLPSPSLPKIKNTYYSV